MTKVCKQHPSSSLTQQSIESFCLSNNKLKNKLIGSTKSKLTNVLAECCAADSLPFALFPDDGFKQLGENLLKAGRQLGATVSIDEVMPDPTTISREIDRIFDFRKEFELSLRSRCRIKWKYLCTAGASNNQLNTPYGIVHDWSSNIFYITD